MELYQIKHFVAVAEVGSFTKGADRAAVSQPALSASIARLESELGVKLFDLPIVATNYWKWPQKFCSSAIPLSEN
jgi:hypothetical protein